MRLIALLTTIIIAALAASAGGPLLAAEESGQAATGPPSVPAVVIDEPPVIDGVLDDACWEQATHVDGFWRERIDAPEHERTEAWLCYDSRAIYVAFRCHDSRPSEIRCDQKKRQGGLGLDDQVQFWLDVENNSQNFYSFRVNPAGTQWDQVPGGTSEKIEWRGDWRAAAAIDEAGWTAEMEIPFSILRYPDGQDCFRFDFARKLAREDDRSLWPVCLAKLFDTERCARWTGLDTPPVRFRYVLMPYALSVLSEEEGEREPLTAGLDARGTFPNGVVALATANPDFSNIEDVVETIDFTYTERWLPDPRPFFQEGSGYFPWSNLFYSRRVEDFDLGAKAFGTVGAERFGVLDAYRRGGENHFVTSYQHNFGTNGGVGFNGVDRRVPGEPDNRAYSVFGSWDWPGEEVDRYVWGDVFGSRTQGEGGDDTMVTYEFGERRRQGLDWHVGAERIGPEFRADDGLVYETGVRNTYYHFDYEISYDDSSVQEREYDLRYNYGHSEQGPRRRLHAEHKLEWRAGTAVWIGGETGVRDGFDTEETYLAYGWNMDDIYRNGGMKVTRGEHYGEGYRYAGIHQALRLAPRWSMWVELERATAASLDDEGNVVPPETSTQGVLITTYDVGDGKTASARVVRRGADTNAYAAYRQRLRRGMDLLVVVGDPNAEQWVNRLAIKAIWCL
jgi:hypothetical protein